MFAKFAPVNGTLNHSLSLAGTSHKAARYLGFENGTLEGFDDSAVASHETVDLAGHKSLEKGLSFV